MKIFNRKNIFLYCLIYTILTIGVSIYNLIRGQVYDSLGYYHEIYRALILALVLMILYYLTHFSFKRDFISSLLEMWPLLLVLLALWALNLLDGFVDVDLLKKYLLYGLLFLLGLIVLSILLKTLSKTIQALLKGSRKLMISFVGLLFVVIMLLPLVLLKAVIPFSESQIASLKGPLYIIAFIFLVLSCLCVILVTNTKNTIKPLCVTFIVVYYIIWLIVLLSEINLTALILLVISFFIPFMIYCINNAHGYSLLMLFIFEILEIVALSTSFIG